MWKMHMETLMRRKNGMETDETVRQAIRDWYLERGVPEPLWRKQKDPDWWIEEKRKYGDFS